MKRTNAVAAAILVCITFMVVPSIALADETGGTDSLTDQMVLQQPLGDDPEDLNTLGKGMASNDEAEISCSQEDGLVASEDSEFADEVASGETAELSDESVVNDGTAFNEVDASGEAGTGEIPNGDDSDEALSSATSSDEVASKGVEATASAPLALEASAVASSRDLSVGADAGSTGQTSQAHSQMAKAETATKSTSANKVQKLGMKAQASASAKTSPSKKQVNPAYEAGFRDGHEYVLVSSLSGSRAITVSGSNVVSGALTRTNWQLWRALFTNDGYVVFVNVATGLALDVSGARAASGTNVGVYRKNGTVAQKWLVTKSGTAYTLISALSGKAHRYVLDTVGASTSDGANIQIFEANGTKAQSYKKQDATAQRASLDAKAKATAMPKGSYALGSAMGSMLALTLSGDDVKSNSYSAAKSQKWTLRVGSDGYATIMCANGKVLDVAGAVATNGANVQVYNSNGTRAQKWIVTKNSNGLYTLESALWPNMVLDVAGASKKSGANVQLYTSNSTKAQRWDLRPTTPKVAASDPVAEGWYILWTSSAKKLCLDVAGAGTANGTAIQLYSGNGTPAQRFHIVKSGKYYRIDAVCAGGKRLDLDAGNIVPGAKVHTWDSESANSLFSFKKTSNGSYLITNVASGLALGVGGAAKQGSAITGTDMGMGGRISFVLDKRAGVLDEGTYTIRTVLPGTRALSVVNGSWSTGARLEMSSYHSDLAQKWHVYAVAGKQNVYRIENLGSGMSLAGASNAPAKQASGSTSNQQWIPSVASGSIVLKCVGTKKALDVSGASTAEGAAVMNWTSNGTNAQKWKFTKVADVDSGLYEFSLASASGKALDEDLPSGNVQVWSSSGVYNQRWYFDKSAGTLVNLSSGKALDVVGAAKTSGTNVQSYEQNGTKAQKWKITYAGGGRFKITSALGASLVLSSAGISDGKNVSSSTDKGGQSQRWRIKRCDVTVSNALRANLKGVDLTGVKGIGIDVSAWQGSINWLAVKNAGVDFAILRIGHGASISDGQLPANVAGCLKYGIPFGLYYYSTAKSAKAAKNEADCALRLMKAAGVTKGNLAYAVYYDLEEESLASTGNRKLLADMASAFLGKIGANGYKTGVYANLNWWNNYLTDPSFAAYDHWVAQWDVPRTTYRGPYTMWQVQSNGSVPGIGGKVDIDLRY